MRSLIHIEVVIAIVALVAVVMASAWLATAGEQIVPVTPPRYDGPPVQILRASVPDVGDFQRDYNVNKNDPFVPFAQREEQRNVIEQRIRDHHWHHVQTGVVVSTPTPARPPFLVQQDGLKPPTAPVCIGFIAVDQTQALLVHFGDQGPLIAVHVGDRLPPGETADKQWTLVSIVNDSQAEFLDPAGHSVLLPIGGPPGEPPPAATTTPAPQPHAPPPPPGASLWRPPGVTMPPGIQPQPGRHRPHLKQPPVVPQQ